MKTILHKADTRNYTDLGWLKAYKTFSFADYYDPQRVHFGALRVLNDDTIAPTKGFGRHPHDNMEILSIPLEGAMKHEDSHGNSEVIRAGEVQVMSGGTGIFHSEFNPLTDVSTRLLQIWMFPNKRDVEPRYQQLGLDMEKSQNQWLQILSPNPEDDGVWVHQNAWYHLGNLSEGQELNYTVKSENNGVYIFVIEGEITVNNQVLDRRDGYGVWETEQFSVKAHKDSFVLLMDVPMNVY